MSKELDALYNFIDDVNHALASGGIHEINTNNITIIETALKRKEQQDNALKVLKEVIEFATISPHVEPNKDNGFNIMSDVGISIQRDIENKERELLRKWVLENCFPKELKALEIIKEKGVDASLVIQLAKCGNGYVAYNNDLREYKYVGDLVNQHRKELTKEEYELLKEVLL